MMMLKTILLVMITILLVMITVMIVVIISSYHMPNRDQKSTVLMYDYVYQVQRMHGSKEI